MNIIYADINGYLMKVQLSSNMACHQYLIQKVEATSCAYLNGHKQWGCKFCCCLLCNILIADKRAKQTLKTCLFLKMKSLHAFCGA